MDFSGRLRYLREQRGMNQIEAAEALGQAVSTYNKWENAKNRPEIDTVIKIAQYYNCSVDYLVGIEDSPRRETADIVARTGLNDEAVKVLEEIQKHPDGRQSSEPQIRTLNTLITQRSTTGHNLLYLLSLGLFFDLDDEKGLVTQDGDLIHTVGLSYLTDVTIYSELTIQAREVVSVKILDAIRDLSQKIKAQQQ